MGPTRLGPSPCPGVCAVNLSPPMDLDAQAVDVALIPLCQAPLAQLLLAVSPQLALLMCRKGRAPWPVGRVRELL